MSAPDAPDASEGREFEDEAADTDERADLGVTDPVSGDTDPYDDTPGLATNLPQGGQAAVPLAPGTLLDANFDQSRGGNPRGERR